MKKLSLLATLTLVLAASPVLATTDYYEDFEGFIGGGAGSTSWGVDATGTSWVHPFGGNADIGFFDVAGYPDDPASAVQFSSIQNDTMQNTDTISPPIGNATAPYAVSFAVKLDDNSTPGSFVQMLTTNNFISPGPGFTQGFIVQIWGDDFINPGDPSFLVVTQINPSNGSPLLGVTGAPNILGGANGFDASGASWNVIIVVADPANSIMRAWVNPASNTATPDIDSNSFTFGSSIAPQFLSIGSYVFASDNTPGTERIVTMDSLKITSGQPDLNLLFQEVYAGYSTLASASIEGWDMF